MRINVSIDEEVYPELIEKLSKVKVKKRGSLLVKLASERMCYESIELKVTGGLVEASEETTNETDILSGYNLDEEAEDLLGDIGVLN